MSFYFIPVFLMALLLTYGLRRYALRHNVLDIPNQRSSHTQPTPRGGGLAIVLAFTAASMVLFWQQRLSDERFWVFSTTLLVAAIGFWDDHAPLAARWRFLVHFLAAGLAMTGLHDFPMVTIDDYSFNLGYFGYAFGAVLLVWLLNLFNFMDGTDGIAASEAVFVAAGLSVYLYYIDPTLALVAGCLAAASAGFLAWNWPPAKIFMGDVGSGFLGLAISLLIFMAAKQVFILLFVGLILFGVFVVDATYTLLYRMVTGQQWYAAHCTHAYQRAAKRYGHRAVLWAAWIINTCWLLPLSLFVFYHPDYAMPGLVGSYLPLMALAVYFQAGRAEVNA
jgi:Fuc2NAc and GlcNAc transferase